LPRPVNSTEPPEGLVYRPGVLAPDEEAGLLGVIAELRFDPIVLHGQAARRTARHYGLGYDYDARTPKPGEPIPDWIDLPRARAAVEVLVQHYPVGATIGWHRDAPAFGLVAGLSLGGASRFRFQRGKGEERRVFEQPLEPRSGYVLDGPARWSWQHSIPATKEERFSITFRTLRR
jgi:DNA oxidative demethylase